MPGRPITDQQMRYYMTLRTRHTRATAAARVGHFAPFRVDVAHEFCEVRKLGAFTGRDSGAAEEHDPPTVDLIHEVDRDPWTVGNEFRHGGASSVRCRDGLSARRHRAEAQFGPPSGPSVPPGQCAMVVVQCALLPGLGRGSPQAIKRVAREALPMWVYRVVAAPRGGIAQTRKTFITSSPRWLMTLTAIRPDVGRSNGRERSLRSVAQGRRPSEEGGDAGGQGRPREPEFPRDRG